MKKKSKKKPKVKKCWCGSTDITKQTHILGQPINTLCNAHYHEAVWEAVADRG